MSGEPQLETATAEAAAGAAAPSRANEWEWGLALLRRIGRIVADASDPRSALARIADCLVEAFEVDACHLFLYDPKADLLRLEATHGLEAESVHRVSLNPEQGITGYCFRMGEIVNTPELQSHPCFSRFPSERADEYRSLLAVPLIAGGRSVGVVDLSRRLAEPLPASTVELMQALAPALAMLVGNLPLATAEEPAVGEPPQARPGLIRGTPVVGGTVRGEAYCPAGIAVLEGPADETGADPAAERKLLAQALQMARDDAMVLHQHASKVLAEVDAAIFYVQALMLEDAGLLGRIEAWLDCGHRLRSALRNAYRQVSRELGGGRETFQQRLADIRDVLLRIHQAADELEGRTRPPAEIAELTTDHQPIVVAIDLLPSQLLRLPLDELRGIVLEEGSMLSHVSILARSLNIAMMIGAEGIVEAVRAGDPLLLDATGGCCYIHPSPLVVRAYRQVNSATQVCRRQAALPNEPVATADGAPAVLGANISLVAELASARQLGAAEIGLYRTEFMFMIRQSLPSEDEQYAVFRQVVEQAPCGKATIRLVDAGDDKELPCMPEREGEEAQRGIRYLLAHPEWAQPHFRAVLRAAAHGDVGILVPMVADRESLQAAREELAQAAAELVAAGHEPPVYRLGLMLEVPSAAIALDNLLPDVDFVSIGTNDLTHFTFAAERDNGSLAPWYRQFHPAMLRLLAQIVAACRAGGDKPLSVCGELASNPLAVPLLLGLGLRRLSMAPVHLPGIRALVPTLRLADCQDLARAALACRDEAAVRQLAQEFEAANKRSG